MTSDGNIIVEAIVSLACEYFRDAAGGDGREARLVFPGLTERLALEIHDRLRLALATGLDAPPPVYLALDDPPGRYSPDESRGMLLYEAVTSVRSGSFAVVCLPKVVPKLHDSVQGSGSPIRSLAFSDEWPWKAEAASRFDFPGQVLERVLDTWGAAGTDRDWLHTLVMKGLLPATAPLSDGRRVRLLLEELLGEFEPGRTPGLSNLVDAFLHHCGLPHAEKVTDAAPYIKRVRAVAVKLQLTRRQHPDFRRFLIDEVADEQFHGKPWLSRFKAALHALFDGLSTHGLEEGLLAFSGGLGRRSSDESVDHWTSLSLERLEQLFGVEQSDTLKVTAEVPGGSGLVVGGQVARFQGTRFALHVVANVDPGHFANGLFELRVRRARKDLGSSKPLTSETLEATIELDDQDLLTSTGQARLKVQLVRAGQVAVEQTINVHTCGPQRPGFLVVVPQFEVVNLTEGGEESGSDEVTKIQCSDPVGLYVLRWGAAEVPSVLAADEPLDMEVEGTSGEDEEEGWLLSRSAEACDPESTISGTIEVEAHADGLGCVLTLDASEVEPGEFTLEDELRVATVLQGGSGGRFDRARDVFVGDVAHIPLPRLGGVDAGARWRLYTAGHFEQEDDGWRPILVDMFDSSELTPQLEVRGCVRASASVEVPPSLRTYVPRASVSAVLEAYAGARRAVLSEVRAYLRGLRGGGDRAVYAAGPVYVRSRADTIARHIIKYLGAYTAVLRAASDADASHDPAGAFLLLHADQVVHAGSSTENVGPLAFGLLGPWHPLVVAKRFMVQSALVNVALGLDRPATKHFRALAALLERTEAFRCVVYQDPVEFQQASGMAFATSDPGWHVVVAYPALARTSQTADVAKEIGHAVQRRAGLRSSLFLGSTELWSPSFPDAFVRANPSRRHLTVRVAASLDPLPLAASCRQAMERGLGDLLPGGVHLVVDRRLDDRDALASSQPPVHIYEPPQPEQFDMFRPDIRLLPARDAWSVTTWAGAVPDLPLPRGKADEAAFFAPIAILRPDPNQLPMTRVLECGEAGVDLGTMSTVGTEFTRTLAAGDELLRFQQHGRPSIKHSLGVPTRLGSEWTILPGGDVDPAAIANYVIAGQDAHGEERALWDFKMDIEKSVSSYFIVCLVPHSLASAVEGSPLVRGPHDAAAVMRHLASVGFAVGETLRSGRAAVGVLGVAGALRLLTAVWSPRDEGTKRSRTLVLSVDSFPGLMLKDGADGKKRCDLLAIQLEWDVSAPQVSIAFIGIECKYSADVYPESAVDGAFAQAKATTKYLEALADLASTPHGMHARLALMSIVRFGLRLLAGRDRDGLAPRDEAHVLGAILRGDFRREDLMASTLLFTTSCGDPGPGGLFYRGDGLWVQLTRSSWPDEHPAPDHEFVRRLSLVIGQGPEVSPSRAQDSGLPAGGGSSGRGSVAPVAPTPTGVAATVPSASGQQATTSSSTNPTSSDDGRFEAHVRPLGDERGTGEPTRPGAASTSAGQPTSQSAVARSAGSGAVLSAFAGFIANEHAIQALSIQIQYAKRENKKGIQNIGLYGPKSTGKTELARRIAKALDIPSLMLSETGLGNVDQLAERMQEKARESGREMEVITREGGVPVLRCPPMLVFIDEVHQLSNRVQDMLLPAIEQSDRVLRGSRVTIDTRDASFVIATTDEGKLREAFRSRVRAIRLAPYTVEQVAEMLRVRVLADSSSTGMAEIDPVARDLGMEALVAVATAARAVPRGAIQLLGELSMAMKLDMCGPTPEEVWAYIRSLVPCDRHGLTALDWRYLDVVGRRGPLGLENIAHELGTDPSNVESAIEPFLTQMGWVVRSMGGRTLTPAGRQLVMEQRSVHRT